MSYNINSFWGFGKYLWTSSSVLIFFYFFNWKCSQRFPNISTNNSFRSKSGFEFFCQIYVLFNEWNVFIIWMTVMNRTASEIVFRSSAPPIYSGPETFTMMTRIRTPGRMSHHSGVTTGPRAQVPELWSQ